MSTIDLQRHHLDQIHNIVNTILDFSLQPMTLQEQLQKALDLILSLDWLALETKGCIFLADHQRQVLNLTVHRGLPDALLIACKQLPYGRCVCGRAASTRQAVYCDHLDERHEIEYDSLVDHGHYCIPILYCREVLGIINLYIPAEQKNRFEGEGFLKAIANTLASLIIRKRAEDDLRLAKLEMEQIISGHTSKDIFNRQLIKRVFEQWHQEREGKIDPWPPPREEHVSEILEIMFLASLKKKEEKATQISVSLLESASLVEEINAYDSMLLRFASPMPFTKEILSTIAPSFDPDTTSLLLTPGQGPSNLYILGAIFFTQRGMHLFDAMTYAMTPLDIFSVTAKKPGHLILFRGNEIIGCFYSGKLSDPMPTTFTKGPMAWNVLSIIEKHPEFIEYDNSYWEVYLDLVDRLLLEAVRRGHGGIFLWVPDSSMEIVDSLVNKRFPLEESPEGSKLLARFLELEHAEPPSPIVFHNRNKRNTDLFESKRELIELVELISQLSCMDGAVILSERMRPVSFGSLISAETWRGRVVSWNPNDDMFPSIDVNPAQYGTRHNSALNFVGKCPGSIAFVLSQDGPIAGLTRKDEQTVYWWPDCLSILCDN